MAQVSEHPLPRSALAPGRQTLGGLRATAWAPGAWREDTAEPRGSVVMYLGHLRVVWHLLHHWSGCQHPERVKTGCLCLEPQRQACLILPAHGAAPAQKLLCSCQEQGGGGAGTATRKNPVPAPY